MWRRSFRRRFGPATFMTCVVAWMAVFDLRRPFSNRCDVCRGSCGHLGHTTFICYRYDVRRCCCNCCNVCCLSRGHFWSTTHISKYGDVRRLFRGHFWSTVSKILNFATFSDLFETVFDQRRIKKKMRRSSSSSWVFGTYDVHFLTFFAVYVFEIAYNEQAAITKVSG